LNLPHDGNPKHINPIFISLSFLPKPWLLPKKKKKKKKRDETVRNPYFIIVLVDNITTFKNLYTKYALPSVLYATKSRCVNQINVSFFSEP
jgi:predicted secreted acid phosphatase